MRNTHYLELSIKPKKEGEKPEPIYIARHMIQAIIPQKEGTIVVVSAGLAYEVVEPHTAIFNKGKSAGIMGVL